MKEIKNNDAKTGDCKALVPYSRPFSLLEYLDKIPLEEDTPIEKEEKSEETEEVDKEAENEDKTESDDEEEKEAMDYILKHLFSGVSNPELALADVQFGERSFEHLCGALLPEPDNATPLSQRSFFRVLTTEGIVTLQSVKEHTVVHFSSDESPQQIDAIIVRGESEIIPRAICSSDFYDLFRWIENLADKASAMEGFLNLSVDEQEYIKFSAGLESDIKFDYRKPVYFREAEKLRLKYYICKSSYTMQQQRVIQELLENVNARSGKNLRRLQYLLNIHSNYPGRRPCHYSDILSTLEKALYKNEPLKRRIAEHLVSSNYTDNRGIHLLLVGSPGSGLTTICKAIADCCGLPMEEVELSGISTPVDILGLDSGYESADAGRIIKAFSHLSYTEVIIGLKNIDKLGSGGKEGNPSFALLSCINGSECYDSFLEVSIDTRNTIWIATCNDLDSVPHFLRSQFEVIRVDDPSDNERLVIAKQYVVPQVLRSFNLKQDTLLFSEPALSEILENFSPDSGLKTAKRNIRTIVSRVLSMFDSGEAAAPFEVTPAFVRSVLGELYDENDPAVRYLRHRDKLSAPVKAEIKSLLNRLAAAEMGTEEKELLTRKIHYLTTLIPEEHNFTAFNGKTFFDKLNETHFGMEKVKLQIAQFINSRLLKCQNFSSIRILLVGPPGSGKSSICTSISDALSIPCVKISLNGASDPSVIKGFPFTYKNADVSEILKGLAHAGTTTALVQLDEIDKMGAREGLKVSNALLDLLDDSCFFTDRFLGIPLDLSNTLFIATANDVSDIEPWLLDRFTVIQLDSYTASDKECILREHLIPKLEQEYHKIGLSISIHPSTSRKLISDYCSAGGMRDLERSFRKLVDDKLFTSPGEAHLLIESGDLVRCLGPKPLPRGNLPKENIPGYTKALAVTQNSSGLVFSVESTVIPGDELLITGLPRESVVDSVKLAKTYIRTHYLNGKNFGLHLHFGEGAVEKDGPSAGAAILLSMLSALFNVSLSCDSSFTGEIDLYGNLFAVGGILPKIQAAELSGCSHIFIPRDNYVRLSAETLQKFSIRVIPVHHVSEVVGAVLPSITKSASFKQLTLL